MGYTRAVLDDVRAQLAPDDVAMKEAKVRREAVLTASLTFRGALRVFRSGSLAHGTANCPVHQRDKGLDADGGVVLDRRIQSRLGPDSASQVGPRIVVEQLRDHVLTLLRPQYPMIKCTVTKRAILLEFNERLASGEDPSVDLVLALTRRDAPGLWIPNTEADRWDPSDPERHTELLTAEPKRLRVVRAHAIRLAKGENKRTATPPLCSFNLEAFGLMFVATGMSDEKGLLALWESGAEDLSRRLTPDPAGVSAPIKVADRVEAVRRLQDAGRRLARALDRDDEESFVREVLQPLWPEFIATRPGETTKARILAAGRSGTPMHVTGAGLLSTTAGTALKQPRSFGQHR